MLSDILLNATTHIFGFPRTSNSSIELISLANFFVDYKINLELSLYVLFPLYIIANQAPADGAADLLPA